MKAAQLFLFGYLMIVSSYIWIDLEYVDSINTEIQYPIVYTYYIPKSKPTLDNNAVRCLAQNIYYEARGESKSGQIAVAYVTLNRKNSKRYPNTICEVVYQEKQFSWTINYKRPNESDVDIDAWRRAVKIAKLVLQKQIPDPTNGSTHYHKNTILPYWAKSNRLVRTNSIGQHVFYRPS